MSKRSGKSVNERLQDALIPEEEQPYPLPENWVWVRLKGVVRFYSGSGFPKEYQEQQGHPIPFFKVGSLKHVDDYRYLLEPPDTIDEAVRQKIKAGIVPKGTIVFAKIGEAIKLNRRAYIPKDSCIDNNLMGFHSIETLLDNDFLYLWSVKTDFYPLAQATTVPSIRKSSFEMMEFPLPPLDEQRRIAAKVEGLLGKIDQAKQLVEEAQAAHGLRRAAILDKAFRGELTKKWREDHLQAGTGTEWLQQLKNTRSEMYERQCQEAKEKRERKPKELYKRELPELEEYSSILDTLPKEWAISNVDFLAHVTKLAGFEYTKYIQLEDTGEVPVVRAQNIRMGRFVEKNIKYISKQTSDLLERSQLHGHELLMTFIGAGTGDVCLAPSGRRWHLAPNVAKITVHGMSPAYLCYFLQSPVGQRYLKEKMKATAQQSLSMETIRETIVHVPPPEEQQEIVAILDVLLKKVDEEHAALTAIDIERIEQSLLSKAFRGELGTP
ncbi:restriction endonuclease subunit S [Paenibacillus puerhi]|uniref:restriction endonuclease subunit S n=1 Tax=Paenibacillus puerhi TaxID=2692622 RepID=UPI00135A6964|nr:restriction endonuclease subunit S [Paenibacillus puerhi]